MSEALQVVVCGSSFGQLYLRALQLDGGTLTLLDSHGPVLFQPTQHLPAALRDAFDLEGSLPPHLAFASCHVLGSDGHSFRDIFGTVWPRGVQAALRDWHGAIVRGDDPRKLGQAQLAVCRIWQHTTAALGYLIGVDEVLTGGWRTGINYLAHQDSVGASDIVSIGKTLSDMTLPMAAVLCTEEVYVRARSCNAAHVQRLQVHYRNQLAAHIAFNALTQASRSTCRTSALRSQQALEAGLQKLVADPKLCRLLGGVCGQGAMLRLTLNPKYFPFDHRSKPGNLLEMAMSHLVFVRCGVFVFLLRFLHRVCSTEADVQEILRRLEQGLRGVTPFMLYRYALSRVLSRRLPRLAGLLAHGVHTVDLAPRLQACAWQSDQKALAEGGPQ